MYLITNTFYLWNPKLFRTKHKDVSCEPDRLSGSYLVLTFSS